MSRVPVRVKTAKLVPLSQVASLKRLGVGKRSKAAVLTDAEGHPLVFLFDTFALLDVLSTIDEALVDRLSTEEYHDPAVNPAGWLIDTIESRLPVNADFARSLQAAIAEAKEKGWIPFEKVAHAPARG